MVLFGPGTEDTEAHEVVRVSSLSPKILLTRISLMPLPPWKPLCLERRYVWWISWNISSRGICVSGPYILQARRSNADTICLTTSSKNMVANWECIRERNSKEICHRKRQEKVMIVHNAGQYLVLMHWKTKDKTFLPINDKNLTCMSKYNAVFKQYLYMIKHGAKEY